MKPLMKIDVAERCGRVVVHAQRDIFICISVFFSVWGGVLWYGKNFNCVRLLEFT